MVSQPIWVAGGVLYQFTGWIGCHLAQLAFYSQEIQTTSALSNLITWEQLRSCWDLGALLLGLNQGGEWGWTSLPIMALLFSAVILLIAIYLY